MKDEQIKKTESVDFGLFVIISILAIAGTIMIISSSSAYAYYYLNGDTYHFLRKQIVWLLLGAIVLVIALKINIMTLKKYSFLIYLVSVALLVLVLVPNIGQKYNDARRWYSLAGFSFQPSELFKISLIIFLSSRLSWEKHQPNTFMKFLGYFMFIVSPIALIFLQPHISASILILLISFTLMYYAGSKIKYYIFVLIILGPPIAFFIKVSDYAQARINSFLNAGSDPSGDGFQIIQSLYAISSGGVFGVGPGKSLRKFLYLPEPYNDFIFAVFSEEFGFIGVILMFTLFFAFMLKGYLISKNVDNKFMSYTAFGIVTLVMFQFIINVAVVSATIPVTGMPLPFFSYGGTSFVILMGQMGLLLNISQYRKSGGLAAKIQS